MYIYIFFPSGDYPACTSSIRLVLTSGLQPIRSVQFAGWTLRPSWLQTADVFCSVGERSAIFPVPFWVLCQMSVSPSPLTFDLAFWANSKRESLIHVGLKLNSKVSKNVKESEDSWRRMFRSVRVSRAGVSVTFFAETVSYQSPLHGHSVCLGQ